MAITSTIRIEEQENQSVESQLYRAFVIFDHGVRYPCQVRDPFADQKQQEEDLEWHFETYLTFPFTPSVRVSSTAASIRAYGISLFTQIFDDPQALLHYRQLAIEQGVHTIQLEIVGSSSFHRLHWEALYDPQLGCPLALHAPIIRRNLVPQIFPAAIQPSTTINILVVVARPAGSRDVGYRTISRPLVDEVAKMKQPIRITLLRPGTYKELATHLEKVTRERGAGYYHVIHFDVHGSLLSYDEFQQTVAPNSYVYQGRFGRRDIVPYEGDKAYLFLESERDERVDAVEASEVAHLLLLHRISIAILNACQSGKYIDKDDTSLGSRLIQAGIQAVLAMGYSVTVSAAQLMMPVLYRELLSGSSLSSALCLARQALANEKERLAFFDRKIELEDWVLPIVYQNQEVRLAVQSMTPQQATAFYQQQAEQYRHPQPNYGFVGRDVDILHIEKGLLTKRNLLLVRGMGGAGKTTLLHQLASWWQRTGLIQHIFYFGYDEKSWTRQQIMHTIAKKLFGGEDFALFQSRSPEAQQAQLVQALYHTRHLIILDNLESITGAALAIRHTLSKKEQGYLHSFLSELVHGQALVLLGSRSTEDWLARGTFDDNRYDLPGLDPEAASLLTERILEQHKATRYRQDPDLRKLIKLLDGFPLALEVVLANLAHQTPTQVLTALQTGDIALKAGESDKRTENILRCIDYSYSNLSFEVQQLLLCLAPFSSVMNPGVKDEYVTHLKKQPALKTLPFDHWNEVVQEAVNWGLLSPDPHIPGFLHLQPVLPYFLRNRSSGEEQQERRRAVEKAFQNYYCDLSKQLNALITSKKAEEQQAGQLITHLEYENLLTALDFALREKASIIDLYNVIDDYLSRERNHQQGEKLDTLVLASFETLSEEDLAGSPGAEFVRALATAANRQIDLKQYENAMESYQKILQMLQIVQIEEKLRRSWQAVAYHQLGIVAEGQRKWSEAEGYYQQALQIKMEDNNRSEQAGTYHQLGRIAQEQRKWQEAERYYQQALQIRVEYNDRSGQASTYHELGMIAQEQGKWQEAERYYQQALQIQVEYNDPYGLASTCGQLGRIAHEQGKWQEAERYYRQALQIQVEHNDPDRQASTYHNLGLLAYEQGKLQEAEEYYQQALQIKKECNNPYGQASTYQGLGGIAHKQGKLQEAEEYYQQALQIKKECNDPYGQASAYHNLGLLAYEQGKLQEAEEYYQQALQIFVDYNDPDGQAGTCYNLGTLAYEQGKLQEAEECYQQALRIFVEGNDQDKQVKLYDQLGRIAQEQGKWQEAEEYYQQALQIFVKENNRYLQALIYHQLGMVAQEQRKWKKAKKYYQQALQIFAESDNRSEQAGTYHQLGWVAQGQGKWKEAERHYQRALQIFVKENNRYEQARTYHYLGTIAIGERRWKEAERYCQQALEIFVEDNNPDEQARIYHDLGGVAQAQGRWQEVKGYYRQALQIFVDYNDPDGQANAYYNLGVVAIREQRWEEARDLFLQALSIFREYNASEKCDIVLDILTWLCQESKDASIPEHVGSVLKMSQQEVEELLATIQKPSVEDARNAGFFVLEQ